MATLLLQWWLTTIAMLVVPYVVPGVRFESIGTALVAAAILGVLNALVRPILVLITLPIAFLTLGLFTLVINAFLFKFVGSIVNGMYVQDFWAAFWGALVVTLVTILVNWYRPKKRVRVMTTRIDFETYQRNAGQPGPPKPKGDDKDVIDI